MTTRSDRRGRPRAYCAEPLEARQLLATISGVVFNDANADGVKAALGEPGLSGWTVYVDGNENGGFDAGELSAASAAGGAWSITSGAFRTRQTYVVRIVGQATWRGTEPAAGEYAVVFSTVSDTVTGLDFGQTKRARVTGTVFNDVNDDGAWDREPVLSGRTVFADANDNGVLDAGEVSDVTDASGDYALAPAAGTYTIRQVQQAGWWQTFPSPPGAGHPVTLSVAQSLFGRNFGNVVATVDLLGVGFAVTSAIDPVPADGQIDVTYQVRNDGTADSAPYRVAFYLSEDATITTSDTLLRSVAQSSAPRHSTVDRTTPLALPRPDPFRTDNQYYVGMIVDPEGDVAETSETNNANRGPLADMYPVTSEADLPFPVDNLNVIARPLTVGTDAPSLLGDEWIGAYDMDVYRFDGVAGHRYLFDLTGVLQGARYRMYDAAWNPFSLNTTYVVPMTGPYYVVISGDPNVTANPRRLTGRVAGATLGYTLNVSDITPEPGPPRLASMHFGPSFRPAQLDVKFDGVKDGLGVAAFLSDDTNITTDDLFLGSAAVGAQPAPPNADVSITLALPEPDPYLTDNAYYVGVIADWQNVLVERDETNNVSRWQGSFRSELDLPAGLTGDVTGDQEFVPEKRSERIGDEWIGARDQDIFEVLARARETLEFDLDRTAGALDSYVRLYDPNWTLLASNDNGAAPNEAAGTDSFLRYTFPTAAWYVLVVSGKGNHTNDPRQFAGRVPASTGSYDLTVTSVPAGDLTGAVFDDTNADGVRDPGEAGLAGRTVYVDIANDGKFTADDPAVLTDVAGAFTFSGLRPGPYVLRQVTPPGWIVTSPAASSHALALASGQPAGPVSFGNVRSVTLAGTAFDDVDADGVRDADEPPRPGVLVYADLNNNGVRDFTTVTVDATDVPHDVPSGRAANLRLEVAALRPLLVVDVDLYLKAKEGYFDAYLTSPAGTSVHVIAFPFTGPFTIETIVDDEATPGPVREKPVEPLSVLDGISPEGMWQLRIDDHRNDAADDGTVDAWSVILTLSEPYAVSGADGAYALPGQVPGTYHVRAQSTADWVPTGPADQVHHVTLAEGGSAALDFGARRRRLQVVDRHVFYNNSALDGRDAAANARDDSAIAPDKQLLPAVQTPGAPNITGYARGINGIMVDVAELLTSPTLADFSFKVPSGFNPSVWTDAPAPTGFAVRDLPGGDHLRRVTFTWPDNLLRNTWLQVGVLANAATRRAAPDLSYVGNLVGETGAGGATRVDGADVLATRAALHRGRAGLDSTFDFNRDGVVNVRDEALVRSAIGHALPVLVAPTVAAPLRGTSVPRDAPAASRGWIAAILSDK